MKGKVLTFIIGFLVGAILATGGFLIYSKTVESNTAQPEMTQMNENGQMGGQIGNMSEPPEKPTGDTGEEPPAMPEEMNNTNN